MFEFPPVGGVVTSSKIRAVKLIRYVNAFDYFVLGCEILFMLFIVYYTIEEGLEVRRCKGKGKRGEILPFPSDRQCEIGLFQIRDELFGSDHHRSVVHLHGV